MSNEELKNIDQQILEKELIAAQTKIEHHFNSFRNDLGRYTPHLLSAIQRMSTKQLKRVFTKLVTHPFEDKEIALKGDEMKAFELAKQIMTCIVMLEMNAYTENIGVFQDAIKEINNQQSKGV